MTKVDSIKNCSEIIMYYMCSSMVKLIFVYFPPR